MYGTIFSHHTSSKLYAQFDIRWKIIFALAFLACVLTAQRINIWEFLCYIVILFTWTALARPPFLLLLKRLTILIPVYILLTVTALFYSEGTAKYTIDFGVANLTITDYGASRLYTYCVKTTLSLYALILTFSTESIISILYGLRKLKFPKILLNILFLATRYIEVIGRQAQQMLRAKKSRSFNLTILDQYRTTGAFLGSLFLRSMFRAERVYQSMLARGYTGAFHFVPQLRHSSEKAPASEIITHYAAGILFILLLSAAKIAGFLFER